MIKRLKKIVTGKVVGRFAFGKVNSKLRDLEPQHVIAIHVNATFNNTHVTVTDPFGNTIIWGSSGSKGFRGKQKKTPYAARSVVVGLLQRIRARRVRRAELIVRGGGKGRRGVARVVRRLGFVFLTLKDKTPIPHNGCRLRKKRHKKMRGLKRLRGGRRGGRGRKVFLPINHLYFSPKNYPKYCRRNGIMSTEEQFGYMRYRERVLQGASKFLRYLRTGKLPKAAAIEEARRSRKEVGKNFSTGKLGETVNLKKNKEERKNVV